MTINKDKSPGYLQERSIPDAMTATTPSPKNAIRSIVLVFSLLSLFSFMMAFTTLEIKSF